MKKLFILILICAAAVSSFAQDFAKRVSEAKTAYSAGKLDDARFAMEQALQELDILTGKEILKLLPAKMESDAVNSKNDNVTGASGFVGVVVHRDYGTVDSTRTKLEIITNSPLIGTLNGILSLPFIANNADQKVIRIHGYKALLQKNGGETDNPNYTIQLPLNSSLIMLEAPGKTADQLTKMANSIPIEDIAKLIQ